MTKVATAKYDRDIKRQAVMLYQAAGLPLFPCISVGLHKSAWKRPALAGWQSVTPDPLLTSDELPATYAVPLPADLIVLDGDPRRYKGTNELDDLCNMFGLLDINTFIVKTGTGGFHVYLRLPPEYRGCRLKQHPVIAQTVYQGIDIKGHGGYAIAAGAWHLEANQHYTIASGTPLHIAQVPSNLMLAILAPALETTGQDAYYEDEGTQKQFIAYLANALPAVSGSGGNNQTFYCACHGRDLGLPQKLCLSILSRHYNPRCQPPWEEDDLAGIVQHAYTYAKGTVGAGNAQEIFKDVVINDGKIVEQPDVPVRWDRYKDGSLKSNPLNTRNIMHTVTRLKMVDKKVNEIPNEIRRAVRYNMFTDRIEFTKPMPWHDGKMRKYWDFEQDTLQFTEWIATHFGPDIKPHQVAEGVKAVALNYRYHPVRDWLNSLLWDGTPRIDTMLTDYAGAEDTEIVQAFSRCTMIAAVARVFEPGCKHDHMLVLEGAQGVGKSTFVRILGGEWAGEFHLDPHSKETHNKLRGKWIVEEPEMACVRKVDSDALKAFITVCVDTYRKSYGIDAKDYPRQFIIIGTINPGATGDYLVDETGNRRFWPVHVREVDFDKLLADREQLFAEAVVRYRQGERWHLTREETALALIEQSKRQRQDTWEGVVADWIDTAERNGFLSAPLTIEYVATMALQMPISKVDLVARKRIATVLRALGYAPTSIWAGKRAKRVWIKQLDKDSINDL